MQLFLKAIVTVSSLVLAGPTGYTMEKNIETRLQDLATEVKNDKTNLNERLMKVCKAIEACASAKELYDLLAYFDILFSSYSMNEKQNNDQKPERNFVLLLDYNGVASFILDKMEQFQQDTPLHLPEKSKQGLQRFFQSFLATFNFLYPDEDNKTVWDKETFKEEIPYVLFLYILFGNDKTREDFLLMPTLSQKIEREEGVEKAKFQYPKIAKSFADYQRDLLDALALTTYKELYTQKFNPNVVFLDKNLLPDNVPPRGELKKEEPSAIIISNNADYDLTNPDKNVKEGKLLKMPDGTPIGYNIFMPKEADKIKSVVVEIYGGTKAEDKTKKAHYPVLNTIGKSLVANDYAYITLNLPDLLKLSAHQLSMPQKLFKKIQRCISYFGNIVKENSVRLADGEDQERLLTALTNKRVFLRGASFGGGMILLQAGRTDTPYDAFISHNGMISKDMLVKSNLHYPPDYDQRRLEKETADFSHLSPIFTLPSISRPVALFQNMDDNAVNPKVVFDAYKKLYDLNPAFVTLYVTPRGNSIPSVEQTHYKGHFLPRDNSFDAYMAALFAFMDNVITGRTAPSGRFTDKTEATGYDLLANRHFPSATVEERCLGELLYWFFTTEEADPQRVKKDWEDIYKAKLENFYRALIHTKLVVEDNAIQHYKIDLSTFRGAEQNRLKNKTSDKNYEDAIDHHLPQFLSFAKEYTSASNQTSSKVPRRGALKRALAPVFKANFFRALTESDNQEIKPYRVFYLEQFYLANPKILNDASLQDLYNWERTVLQESMRSNMPHRELEERIAMIETLTQPKKIDAELEKIKEKFIKYITEMMEIPPSNSLVPIKKDRTASQ